MFLLFAGAILGSCTRLIHAKVMENTHFDWQGHRGARGLQPENTVPAFLAALAYPAISTLELDVAITADSQIVVSHEPWFSAEICSHPTGQPVVKAEAEGLRIFQMSYAEVAAFDCGNRGNSRFPDQQAQPAVKPLLRDVVSAVANYCKEKGRPAPRWNIEIKSNPDWDNVFTPPPAVFAQLVVDEISALGLTAQVCVQSFDVRSLQAVRAIDTTLMLALLVEDPLGVDRNLTALGFVPDVYSPYYRLVTAEMIERVHQQRMRIIPWTVNETAVMQQLRAMGVDGIITDYPNRIPVTE